MLLWPSTTLRAQGAAGDTVALGAVRVAVEVGESVARVTLDVRILAEASSSVALRGLRFDDVEIRSLRMGPPGEGEPLGVRKDSLEFFATVPGPVGEGFMLHYEVPVDRDGDRIDVTVPLPMPEVATAARAADFFEGSVTLPPGFVLRESFPTGMRRTTEREPGWETRLPVVPAVMRVSAIRGSGWSRGLWWVEAGGILAVVALSWLGWRHLQGQSMTSED